MRTRSDSRGVSGRRGSRQFRGPPSTQFVVVADRDAVVLKVLNAPKLDDFAELLARARKSARESGMRRSDVAAAIKKVRRER